MNRLAAAIALLAFSLFIGISGYFYVCNAVEDISADMKLDRSLTFESGAASSERAENIQTEWKKREKLLAAILPHSELDEIEMNIKKLTMYEQQGLNEEYIKTLDDCISRFEHISETEKPDFKNVF